MGDELQSVLKETGVQCFRKDQKTPKEELLSKVEQLDPPTVLLNLNTFPFKDLFK